MAITCTRFETQFLAEAFTKHAKTVRAADVELRKIVRLAVESRELDPETWGVKVDDGVFVFTQSEDAVESEDEATKE